MPSRGEDSCDMPHIPVQALDGLFHGNKSGSHHPRTVENQALAPVSQVKADWIPKPWFLFAPLLWPFAFPSHLFISLSLSLSPTPTPTLQRSREKHGRRNNYPEVLQAPPRKACAPFPPLRCESDAGQGERSGSPPAHRSVCCRRCPRPERRQEIHRASQSAEKKASGTTHPGSVEVHLRAARLCPTRRRRSALAGEFRRCNELRPFRFRLPFRPFHSFASYGLGGLYDGMLSQRNVTVLNGQNRYRWNGNQWNDWLFTLNQCPNKHHDKINA